MKILNPSQIYKADSATLKGESIEAVTLMERVGKLCFDWIVEYFDQDKSLTFLVFCGVGNNGGDGLVIARYLVLDGYKVKVFVVNFSDKYSKEFLKNRERLESVDCCPVFLNTSDEFPIIPHDSVVIDAIFGLGLKRSPEGFIKDLIRHLNNSKSFILAIDLPSGLYADRPVDDAKAVITANHTLTFQNPKLAFLLPDNAPFSETWEVLPIGLDQVIIDEMKSDYTLTLFPDILAFYKQRKVFSHKGSYGHALLIGGSYGKIGAVVLSVKAANVVGSGLVTALLPQCGYAIMQTSVPEAMAITSGEKYILNFENNIITNAIGIGMGMGLAIETQKAFIDFVTKTSIKLVLDADALNCLALNKEALSQLPENSILTPHPKELERLIGHWKNDYEKLDKVGEFSKEHKVIIVLKGAYTVIVNNGKYYFNSTGNPALATAGSGDVLTGIITGLMAQNYTALQAAILGVYLHGSTADIAIEEHFTYESFIASDIIDYLPNAYKAFAI